MSNAYENLIGDLRRHYESGATLPVKNRIDELRKLKSVLKAWEPRLLDAVNADLGKAAFEGYETELGVVQAEISHMIKKLPKWAKTEKVPTPLAHFPSRSYVLKQPKGVVLVMSPWNYPLQLALNPVASAIAAGCCVCLKPSRHSQATSACLKEMLESEFAPGLVRVVEGGHQANTELLKLHWDHIFFTGSPNVGKVVMEAAAKNLTPVTLELGGKSPCIIDGTTDLKLAATRLAWGKFLNVGQTCVAPDYLLIKESCLEEFTRAFRAAAEKMYPGGVKAKDLGKIVNEKHFERLKGLLEGQKVAFGGETDEEAMKIAPTMLLDVDPESPVMKEEIFGPILPVITWRDFSEVIDFVRSREKPLALYIFSKDRKRIREVQAKLTYGGGCVNDTVVHLSNPNMPFGGVGASGMGSYHSREGFETFTHRKSVLRKSLLIDLPVRYAPYRDSWTKLLKLLLK